MLLFPYWRMDFALYHYFAMVQHFVIVLMVFAGWRSLREARRVQVIPPVHEERGVR